MSSGFYENAITLDNYKIKEVIKENDVQDIIKIIKDDGYYRYFFFNLKEPKWLSNKTFETFITNNIVSTNKLRCSYACYYLNDIVAFAGVHKTIARIFKKVQISDPNVKWIAIGIIEKLDSKYIAKLIPNIKQLIQKNIHEQDNLSVIIRKLIEGKNNKQAMLLLDHITKPEKEILSKASKTEYEGAKLNNAKSILDEYEFKEFINSVLPKLKESIPVDTVKIFTKNLIRCFEIEASNKKYKEDFSWIWRSAIEEHEQNYDFGKYNEVMASTIRDVLEHIAKSNYKPFLDGILKKYLKSPYSIFRRLAIHICRLNFVECKDIASSIVSDYKYFNDYKVKHEYYLLLRDHFLAFDDAIRNQLVKWIDNGPDVKNFIKYEKKQGRVATDADIISYQEHWRYERFWIIREHLPERTAQIESYKKQFNELKHPDLPSWHEESIGGYKSPLTVEQVLSLPEDVLIQLFKYPPNVPEDPRFQYYGFAKIFEEAIRGKIIDENKLFINPAKLSNDEIAPIFISHLFQGLSNIWKEKPFEWSESLTQLSEYVIGRRIENSNEERGKYSRVRFELVSLVEIILQKKDFPITPELLKICRNILVKVVGDAEPSLNDELNKQNNDWSFRSLNYTSGRVMHALIHYSLRYAQEKKDTFTTNQSKLDPVVRQVFEKVIKEEKRPSVRSVFGMYLANLWYLDAEWIKTQLPLLFPLNNPLHRSAVWETYLLFNNLYKDIYESLSNEYKRSVMELDPKNENDQGRVKLSEHISLIYLRGWDDFANKKSITKLFINRASLLQRNQFIWRIGKALEDVKARDVDGIYEKVWDLSKQYWVWRVDNIKPKQDVKNHQDELTTFFGWIEYSPESIVELFPLIKKTLKKRNPIVSDHIFTKYLAANSKEHPYLAIQLYYEYYNHSSENARYYADQKQIEAVMENVLALKTIKGNNLVRDFSNRLGELGLFEYKKYWEVSKSLPKK